MALTPVEYRFHIIGGRKNDPQAFVDEANRIGRGFFGDGVFTVEISVTGQPIEAPAQYEAACVARAVL